MGKPGKSRGRKAEGLRHLMCYDSLAAKNRKGSALLREGRPLPFLYGF